MDAGLPPRSRGPSPRQPGALPRPRPKSWPPSSGRTAIRSSAARIAFRQIDGPHAYQQRVPLSRYEDYAEAIDRIAEGGRGVLTRDRVELLEPTSGTSGGEKLDPLHGLAAPAISAGRGGLDGRLCSGTGPACARAGPTGRSRPPSGRVAGPPAGFPSASTRTRTTWARPDAGCSSGSWWFPRKLRGWRTSTSFATARCGICSVRPT